MKYQTGGRIHSKTRKTLHKGGKKEMKIRGRLIKQRWNKSRKCYFLDFMNDDEKRKTVCPHREVARAFVENPDPKQTMIVHIDNNPRNNKAENLKWHAPSGHMKRATKTISKFGKYERKDTKTGLSLRLCYRAGQERTTKQSKSIAFVLGR